MNSCLTEFYRLAYLITSQQDVEQADIDALDRILAQGVTPADIPKLLFAEESKAQAELKANYAHQCAQHPYSLAAPPTFAEQTEYQSLLFVRQELAAIHEHVRAHVKIYARLRERLNSELAATRRRVAARERDKEELERRRAEEEQERRRRAEAQQRHEEQRALCIHEFRKQLEGDFLRAKCPTGASCGEVLSDLDLEREKADFAKSWLINNSPRNGDVRTQIPDDEQAAAVAAVHGHIQVVARAGSGKTATLVNRAFFLIRHCRVAASQMLLLAFNRKAAQEMRRRLLGLLHDGAEAAISSELADRSAQRSRGGGRVLDNADAEAVTVVASRLNVPLPHVMTFHALAYAVVHPDATLIYNDAEGKAQALSSTFERVIREHLDEPHFKDKVRQLMLAHFRGDWDRIVEGGYDRSKEDLLAYRRSLPTESIRGEYVKSFGEKAIADFLFEHDIPYKYERNYRWSGINYRPDFTVFLHGRRGIVIEYFGLEGDIDYDDMSARKREFWAAQRDWRLIEFSPKDFRHGGIRAFHGLIKQQLEDQGVRCVKLSDEEIWSKIRVRAISRFADAATNFVGRCRKRSLGPSELRHLVNAYSPLSDPEGDFLELACRLYSAYLEHLRQNNEEDFDGLMQSAAERIHAGQTLFERKAGAGDLALLKYLFIDEFQDFSDLFYRLLVAIRKHNTEIELFCVGDDWQAINGFAGSDLRFFQEFQKYIGSSRQLQLSTNYRSSRAIVEVGNALMHGLGEPSVANKRSAGQVVLVDLGQFEPSPVESEVHSGDYITPVVLRLASRGLAEGRDVVMLSRRNGLPWYVAFSESAAGSGNSLDRFRDHIRSFFPETIKERISASTAHKYKGLEKPMVIVLDAVSRSYPLIHPDWVFSRVLGDTPEGIAREERRLFYVALTRAIDTAFVITDGRSKSPFLDEVQAKINLPFIDWSEYPPYRASRKWLVVRVGNQQPRGMSPTYTIREQLKASGYEWRPRGQKEWAKLFPARGFHLETLKAEIWAEVADGIEVRICDEAETLVAHFQVNSGIWMCLFNDLHAVIA